MATAGLSGDRSLRREGPLRRPASLAVFALVASLILTPAAAAQDQYEEPIEEQVKEEIQEEVGLPVEVVLSESAEERLEQVEQKTGEPVQVDVGEPVEEAIRQEAAQQTGEPVQVTLGEPPPPKMIQKEKAKAVPKTGGPALGSLLMPAAVLLVGSGVLAFAVLRRR